MEGFVLDFALMAVFFITIGIYTYRGLVKSVMGFLIIIASFIISKLFGALVGILIDDWFLFDAISGLIKAMLVNTIGEGANSIDGAALFESMPASIKAVLEFAGADLNSIGDYMTNLGDSVNGSLVEVAGKIAAPISAFISELIGYIGLFLVSMIVLKILSPLVIGITELPLIRTLNRFGGFVAGCLIAFIAAWALVEVLNLTMGVLVLRHPEIEPFMNVNNTYIYSFFAGLNN